MGQGKDQVNASPTELRKAIAQARTKLGEHLRSLSNSTLRSGDTNPGDMKMQPTKQAPSNAKKAEKLKAKSQSGAETKTTPKRKKSVARKANGVAAKAGHVLDTMAAGAVVGAVKAAAQSIEENEAKSLKGNAKTSKSTSDVLSKMAPNAAVGAIAGAARAVVPQTADAKGQKGAGKKR